MLLICFKYYITFSWSPFDRRWSINNFFVVWHGSLVSMFTNLLARTLKYIFLPFSVFFSVFFNGTFLSTSNSQGISCFHKSNCTYLYYFYHMCFIQFDSLANIWRWANLIGLLYFDIALSKILLTACAYQL